ncbi:hypothetical protein CLAFUW4_02394 [Fulvia fulva]|uniref:Uncharacterized protein n=1 Tax=Passalora fulva TaxID=5499 RepID=A0A9Q8LAQ3_PASFU|nr:uncharacterized protein CLAFUR5_02382 [Fulvia fulva]KAK4631197.1 hypothetical protein CLAFUR4_02389 [Fulvia fulva]KAK4633358.1 hypothetical protein CLAFUR0_02393 [Fulvia fulva]UJO13954.1 hypothetical protein CLAFUR5_02382 [Fulvia fulva]WPV10940.1 hypothetical protein CLAFUW4_02394 [Fulvia fulva]WPV25875.1 hypothetical protein CLAFUW7_02394 [Fulvia fulva]
MNYTAIRLNDTHLPYSCQATGYKVRCGLFEIQDQPSAAIGRYETINVNVGRYEVTSEEMSRDCTGHYTWKTCSFRSAIAESDMLTYNDTLVKVDTRSPRALKTADNSERAASEVNATVSLTIGGIGLLASMNLYTAIGMWEPGSDFPHTDNVNTWQTSLIQNADDFHARKDCAPKWKDLMDDITATLNELMFRTSVEAARSMAAGDLLERLDAGFQTEYQVDGLRIDAQPVFQTRWPFYWAAASVQVLCVLLVLITYRHYWLLGRTMSLSPLEIARPSMRQSWTRCSGRGPATLWMISARPGSSIALA